MPAALSLRSRVFLANRWQRSRAASASASNLPACSFPTPKRYSSMSRLIHPATHDSELWLRDLAQSL